MATAVITASNVIQGVESDGLRSVEATLDFDTGDYVTGGLDLPLGALGLTVVNKAFVVASEHVDNQYTEAEFDTAQATVTQAFFVNLDAIDDPKLLIYVADAEHGASALDASTQVRLRLVGT